MDFTEKTISTKKIFKGRVVDLQVDTVSLPNGNTSTREIIRHPGGVCIVALDSENRVFLVRQFRKPLDKTIVEIPAGKLEYGEDPKPAAERELEEEIGYRAKNIRCIGSFYSSPGFCDEVIYLYLATELEEVGQHTDEDEFLEVFKMDFDKLYNAIVNNEIIDGKTAIAVLKAKEYLKI